MKTGYQTRCPVGRFLLKVRITEDGCWQWTGCAPDGYGRFSTGGHNGPPVLAHRWLWERVNGPVPAGRDLDHLCRNRSCVNPAHLEPVTRSENVKRGAGVGGVLRDPSLPLPRPKPKTHCKHGHPLSGDNLHIATTGQRVCRTCDRLRGRRRAPDRREYMHSYYLAHKAERDD